MDAAIPTGDFLRGGRYEIQRLLGSARDKKVYLAYDHAFDTQVAVDIFSSDNSVMPGGLSVSAWEARILGRLGDHPNIATVIDYWAEGGTAIMVTRYLPGGTLRDLIARSRESGESLPVENILRISAEIANGLAYIHRCRILYRDLQPRNVLFDDRGTVHLVDFDTAISLDDRGINELSRHPATAYVAPELIEDGGADERADLYSLGATIYEMCDGRPPFAGTREEISAARRAGPAPPLNREDLPDALRNLVSGLLELEPAARRPVSAAQVVERLQDIRSFRDEIERLLASDESARLEFKSSLRVPINPLPPGNKKSPKEIEQALELEVLKTLAAFLNTDGGTLIIGITDDGTIVGIEVDYPRVRGSKDGWRKTFDNLVSRDLGVEVMKSIDLQLEPWQGKTIAVIRCAQREEPTWMGDELYVRRTASTENLSPRHAVAWWRERWGSSQRTSTHWTI